MWLLQRHPQSTQKRIISDFHTTTSRCPAVNLKDAVSWICPVLRLTPQCKFRVSLFPAIGRHIIEVILLIRLISDRAAFHFALLPPSPTPKSPSSAAALPVTRMARWQLCLNLLTITCCAAGALGAHAVRPVHLPPTLALSTELDVLRRFLCLFCIFHTCRGLLGSCSSVCHVRGTSSSSAHIR